MNAAGIFGLLAAIENPPVPKHDVKDFLGLLSAVKELPSYMVYCARDVSCQGKIFSFNHKNRDCSEIGRELFERFGIETRVGLHCAPLAHKTIKTFPGGTVRIATSVFHSCKDFEFLLNALKEMG